MMAIRHGDYMKRVVIGVMVIFASGIWIWSVTRPYESSNFADVSWKVGGAKHVATIHVLDVTGQPLQGIYANTKSNSGWSSSQALTDAQGVVKIEPGESDVIGVEVGGVQVMSRDLLGIGLLAPSVRNGLEIEIRIKDPSRLRKGH